MAAGFTHHVSPLGPRYSQRSERQPETHGSPLTIFRSFAASVALVVTTGSALASVVYLAHLINTSWQIY